MLFRSSDDPKVQEFVKNFKTKFGSEPSALTAQAYDSAGIYFTAVEKLGSDQDSAAVRDAIAEMSYEGVTGTTKFDANGDVEKSFTKVTIKNGEFVLLESGSGE